MDIQPSEFPVGGCPYKQCSDLDSAEHVVEVAACVIYGAVFNSTEVGTLTIRDAGATGTSNANVILSGQDKKDFNLFGVEFKNGFTYQKSVTTDLPLIFYKIAT